MNCSVDTNHQCIRTYYARLFEAKFLSGLVAGALCKNGKIGYMADYPICGMIANINAFAIGVKMVNPNATIQLEWTTVRSKQEILEDFKANEVNLVSCLEMIVPNSPSRYFGLVNIEKDEPENLTAVIWNWGALYKSLSRLCKMVLGTVQAQTVLHLITGGECQQVLLISFVRLRFR